MLSSYLLLPLVVIFKGIKSNNLIIIGSYGLLFFLFLIFHYYIPDYYNRLYNISYTAIEYCFLTSFVFFNIESKKIRKLIVALSFGFLSFQLFFYLNKSIQNFDSVPIGIETLLLFIYIFLFLHQVFKNSIGTFVTGHYCFWISIGILIYLGGSFFFNILANELPQEQVNQYWFLTYIAETIKNLLFIIGIITFSSSDIKIDKKNHTSIPNLDMI